MKNNKIWCKHIKYWRREAKNNVETYFGLEDFHEASGWSYIYSNLAQTEKWNFCPVCGIKRPKYD